MVFSDVLIPLIPFPLRSGPVVVQHLPVLRLIAFRGFSVTKPDARDSESYAKNQGSFSREAAMSAGTSLTDFLSSRQCSAGTSASSSAYIAYMHKRS